MNSDAISPLGRVQAFAVLLFLVGVIGSVVAFTRGEEMFARAYLFAYMVWFGVTMGCVVFMFLHHSTRSNWSKPVLRLVEAGAGQVLLVAVLAIPIVFLWRTHLYPWANPAAAGEYVNKRWFLNDTGFIVRIIAYFAILLAFSAPIRRWSLMQDKTHDWDLSSKRVNLASPGILVFFLVMTAAITDLVMSLDPMWFSTIFGVIFIIGQSLWSLSLVTVMAYIVRRSRPFDEAITEATFHDLGKMLLTMVMFWGYTAISQFLIIWSGNLPAEVVFYTRRMAGNFWYLGTALIALQFALPFLALLSARTKQKPHWLLRIAILLIAMRLVDLFWIIVAFYPGADAQIGTYAWMGGFVTAALGGIWLFLYVQAVKAHQLVADHEPVGIVGTTEALDHV